MGDIIKKMDHEVAERFFGDDVFLPTLVAVPAHNGASAIEAVLFLAFGRVAHNKFLLKISKSHAAQLNYFCLVINPQISAS